MIVRLFFVIRLLKSAFSSQAGRGLLPCPTRDVFARRRAAVSEHDCWLSTSPTEPLAPTQPRPGWDTLLGKVPFACAPYWTQNPLCLCAILRDWTQKASGSDVARGLQLWLSEGFTPAGLSQTSPSVALDISETSLSSSLLLSFQVGPWLLLALVQRVALAYSLLVTSRSPPTRDGAGLGGKAGPVFPILYVFLRFLFQHFSI